MRLAWAFAIVVMMFASQARCDEDARARACLGRLMGAERDLINDQKDSGDLIGALKKGTSTTDSFRCLFLIRAATQGRSYIGDAVDIIYLRNFLSPSAARAKQFATQRLEQLAKATEITASTTVKDASGSNNTSVVSLSAKLSEHLRSATSAIQDCK